MSIADYYYDMYDPCEATTLEWESRIHEDQNWKEWRLSEMTDSHLLNTIIYFNKNVDTTPLQNELTKRYA